MSPTYYTCISCEQPTSDEEDYRYCCACKEIICPTCKETSSLGKHMYGCKICRNDEFTKEQLMVMLREFMEFESNWLQLRDILRGKQLLPPAPVLKHDSDLDMSESETDEMSETETEEQEEKSM